MHALGDSDHDDAAHLCSTSTCMLVMVLNREIAHVSAGGLLMILETLLAVAVTLVLLPTLVILPNVLLALPMIMVTLQLLMLKLILMRMVTLLVICSLIL